MRKVPVGVVGAITPWNFPFEVSIVKVAQALATGNTIVLKPAPDTPFHATLIAKVVAESTDIPAGVVNVVTSSDHLVGEELTLSPLVDCISFTGSTAVGKRIMEKGAATMKRLFLELGGKSAAIILDDADLPSAAMVGFAVCAHSGQGCAIPTRMLLPRSRYDEGVELVLGYLANAPYGDPQDPGNMMGPLVSATQRERVLGHIARGVDEGATLALGGGRPAHLPTGFFVEPTVFTDVDNTMSIAREEIFGPVLVGHRLRRRRRRRPHRQRQHLRPQRHGHLGLARPGDGRGQAHPHRHGGRERRVVLLARRARSAASRTAASAARTASPASSSTSRSSRWPSRRPDHPPGTRRRGTNLAHVPLGSAKVVGRPRRPTTHLRRLIHPCSST